MCVQLCYLLPAVCRVWEITDLFLRVTTALLKVSIPLSPPPYASLSLYPYSAGIAVGFYGNGETCDGVNRLTYSLRHANRTVSGVQRLVRHWCTLGYVHMVLYPSKTHQSLTFSLTYLQLLHCVILISWEKSLQSKCVCVSVGVRKYISSEPDCGRESSATKGPVCKAYRLPVHHTETAGSAGWAGSSDGWHSFLEQPQHLLGGSGNPDWTIWLVQVRTFISVTERDQWKKYVGMSHFPN